MDIWLYVAIVVVPLLVFGWIVDRRSTKLRRGLPSRSGHPSARATQDPIGGVERTAPGTTIQPSWNHQHPGNP